MCFHCRPVGKTEALVSCAIISQPYFHISTPHLISNFSQLISDFFSPTYMQKTGLYVPRLIFCHSSYNNPMDSVSAITVITGERRPLVVME